LISLDSDERIQGHPRESNSLRWGLWERNGHAPRKPKLIGRANVNPAAEKKPKVKYMII
jgi:hypothetical protein